MKVIVTGATGMVGEGVLLECLLAWIYPIGRALYPAGFCTLPRSSRR